MTGDTLNRPVAPGERIGALDALRGFALFGILIINMRLFTGWAYMPADLRAAGTGPADLTARFLHDFLFFHKFYSLFALLFGIGFALQLASARRRDDSSFAATFARRMVLLFGFGLLHLSIYEWDILHLYAICGLVLLLFRNTRGRTLLCTGALLIVVAPVVLRWMIVSSGGDLDPQAAIIRWGEAVLADRGVDDRPWTWLVQTTGTWGELFRYNLYNPLYRIADVIERGFLFQIFGTFLVGLWVGQRLALGRLLDEVRLLWGTVVAGLMIGLPANWAAADLIRAGVAPYSRESLLVEIWFAVGVTPLSLAYAAAFGLLWRTRVGRIATSWMAPAGRTALTSYMGQSVICILLFYGVGFGLAGSVFPARWTWIAAVIFAGQALLSAIWLRRFAYGPIEWVWRRATYLRSLAPSSTGARRPGNIS